MNGAASYVISVTAAAMVTAVVLSLAGDGAMGGVLKLLAGIFMTLSVASPLLKLELPDPGQWMAACAADGRAAAAAGEEMADEAAGSFIKSRTEAYILDKAACCGAAVTAEVSVDEDGIPTAVKLTGAVTPYARSRLAQIIRTDLGIGEEAQQWCS